MSHPDLRFFDQATVYVRAGDGGNGRVSFRREKFVPLGGPDGGDGGHGGSVYMVADPKLNTLLKFQRRGSYLADSGKPGGSSSKTGRSAAHLEIPVPTGTVVRDAESAEIMGDLVEPGQSLLVARGGTGGRGNIRFRRSHNKAPRIADKGEPGDYREVVLELKLLLEHVSVL